MKQNLALAIMYESHNVFLTGPAGSGKTFVLNQFIKLKKEHLRFHELARQALDHAHHQRMDLASTLLNTEFERSRARVLDMLRGMQKT